MSLSNQKSVRRPWLPLPLVLALAACAHPVPRPEPGAATVEQRLMDLERRVNRLESRPATQAPFRSRAEIQAQVRELEGARARLLTQYTDQHPAVRDIERQLLILNQQLRGLEP